MGRVYTFLKTKTSAADTYMTYTREYPPGGSKGITTDFQLFFFNFEQTRTVTVFGEHGTMAHIP